MNRYVLDPDEPKGGFNDDGKFQIGLQHYNWDWDEDQNELHAYLDEKECREYAEIILKYKFYLLENSNDGHAVAAIYHDGPKYPYHVLSMLKDASKFGDIMATENDASATIIVVKLQDMILRDFIDEATRTKQTVEELAKSFYDNHVESHLWRHVECDDIAKDVFRKYVLPSTEPYTLGIKSLFKNNDMARHEIFKRVVEMLEPGKNLIWVDWQHHKGADYKACILEVSED